jgi:hypothetical protein
MNTLRAMMLLAILAFLLTGGLLRVTAQSRPSTD